MQFSPSTSSADSSLAAVLFPAAGSSTAGAAAATAEPAAAAFETLFAGLTPAANAAPIGAAPAVSAAEPVFPLTVSGPAARVATATRPAAEATMPMSLPTESAPVSAVTAVSVSPSRTAPAKSKPVRGADDSDAGTEAAIDSLPLAEASPVTDPKLAAEALASFLSLPAPVERVPETAVEPETEDESQADETGEEMAGLSGDNDENLPDAETADTPLRVRPASARFASAIADSRAPIAEASVTGEGSDVEVRIEASRLPVVSGADLPVSASSEESFVPATSTATPALASRPALLSRPTDFVPQRDLDRGGLGRAQSASALSPEGGLAPVRSGLPPAPAEVAASTPWSVAPAAAPFASSAPIVGGRSPVGASADSAGATLPEAVPGIDVRITVETASRLPGSAPAESRPAPVSARPEAGTAIAPDSEPTLAAVRGANPEPAPTARRSAARTVSDAIAANGAPSEVRPANLAAPRDFRAIDSVEAKIGADKNFLPSEGEGVAKRTPGLGTAVANRDLAMYSRTLSTLPTHPASGYDSAGAGLAAAPESFPSDLPETAPVEVVANPHRAVEAVLTAVDRAAGRDQTSVKLDFAIGHESLAVRVELHDGEVRATFRTESPELRAALAHEWQQAASGGDRSVKFAPADFTSAEGDPQSGHSDEGFARQQERDVWREETQQRSEVRTLLSRLGGESAPGSDRPAAALRPAASATSSRLNLFA